MSGAAPASIADPALEMIRAFQAGNDAYNDTPDVFEDDEEKNEGIIEATYGPALRALAGLPAATTRAGAIAALELAIEEGACASGYAEECVLSALGYLKGLGLSPIEAGRAE